MAELPSSIGRYEVVSRLGQGGMGSLFLAKDPKIGRLIAIKLVRQEFDSPGARQRFAREAQSAGTLRHQNIVTIFDVDEHEGLPFIAMEYIDGQTLAEIVRGKAPIEQARRLQWIEDLCGALAYAHRQGVIHRDIKPANLMVDTEGMLKVLDFGLARIDESTFTQTQTLIGTPNYMSPEQIKGGTVDSRSDIFSVGCVLYEILAYAPAFPGAVHQAMHRILNEAPAPIETLVAGLDPRVSAIVHRALDKDVERRYPDLNVMKQELAAARLPPAADQKPEAIPPLGVTAAGVRRPTHQSGVRYSPESLQRRRNEQIEKKLEEARKQFEAGQIDEARTACEEALFIEPQLPAAVRLMADITGELEKRQIATLVSDARMALTRGQLDQATARANEAMAVRPSAPEVILLLDAIETATRELARSAQIQEALDRARAHADKGEFDSAIAAAADVLGLDPDHAGAAELQSRARQGLEAIRLEHERNLQAEFVMAEARALFDRGDRDAAIATLAAFPYGHDDLAILLEEMTMAPPPAPPPAPSPVPPPPPIAPVDSTASSLVIPRVDVPHPVAGAAAAAVARSGAAAATPSPIVADVFDRPAAIEAPAVRRRSETGPPAPAPAAASSSWASGRTIALVVVGLLAVGSIAVLMMRGDGPSSAQPPAVTNPEVPPAVAPAPSRPVSPPARVIDDAIQTQNDDDATVAFQLVYKGRLDEAATIVARIRKRDPNYNGLRNLEEALALARDSERATRKPGS
jgi:serine/threonine protein kinase